MDDRVAIDLKIRNRFDNNFFGSKIDFAGFPIKRMRKAFEAKISEIGVFGREENAVELAVG